jgi:tetratricopeptide (TPR) repeat protein
MRVAWLWDGAAGLAFNSGRWIGRQDARTLWMLALIAVALWVVGASIQMRRKRRLRNIETARAAIQQSNASALREQLRLRLSEPASWVADPNADVATLGAGEAFEADLEAAIKSVLLEAGGQRAKAKELLRQRLNGNGAHNGALNGSEAGYWRQLGALSLLDSTADALAAYERAADLAPGNPETHMRLGVLHLRAGNPSAAEVAFRRQMRLAATGPEGCVTRYRAATMLGDVHLANGAHEDAMAAYVEAQGNLLTLLERDPDHTGYQRDVSVTYDRIGDVRAARGDLTGALENYRRGLEIAEALVARAPNNDAWQRDLSVSHDRIADVLVKLGDLEGALASYRMGLAIAEALAAGNPDSTQRQWDLSVSCERTGDVLAAQGKLGEAVEAYRRGLAIAEGLAARDAANIGWQRDLAVSYHKAGELEAALNNAAEARDLLQKGRAIILRLVRIAARGAQWRADLAKFDATIRGIP